MTLPRPYKLVVGLLVGMICATAATAETGLQVLTDHEYKREVLMYCGGSDADVIRGFLDRQSEIVDQYAMDAAQQQQAQSDARQLAYAEWQNRGLGGFKGWCRNEGKDYLRQLRNFAQDDGDTQ